MSGLGPALRDVPVCLALFQATTVAATPATAGVGTVTTVRGGRRLRGQGTTVTNSQEATTARRPTAKGDTTR